MKNMQPLIYAVLLAMGMLIGDMLNSSQTTADSKLNNILRMINNYRLTQVSNEKYSS